MEGSRDAAVERISTELERCDLALLELALGGGEESEGVTSLDGAMASIYDAMPEVGLTCIVERWPGPPPPRAAATTALPVLPRRCARRCCKDGAATTLLRPRRREASSL